VIFLEYERLDQVGVSISRGDDFCAGMVCCRFLAIFVDKKYRQGYILDIGLGRATCGKGA
jgi:hypothetical protein